MLGYYDNAGAVRELNDDVISGVSSISITSRFLLCSHPKFRKSCPLLLTYCQCRSIFGVQTKHDFVLSLLLQCPF